MGKVKLPSKEEMLNEEKEWFAKLATCKNSIDETWYRYFIKDKNSEKSNQLTVLTWLC